MENSDGEIDSTTVSMASRGAENIYDLSNSDKMHFRPSCIASALSYVPKILSPSTFCVYWVLYHFFVTIST